MDCSDFADRLHGLSVPDEHDGEALGHAEICPRCALSLSRVRTLAAVLERMPAPEFPSDLDERVFAAIAAPAPRPLRRWLAAAAALVLLAAGLAFGPGLLGYGGAHGHLKFRVIDEPGNGFNEQSFGMRQMFGPEGSPVAVAGGSRRDR